MSRVIIEFVENECNMLAVKIRDTAFAVAEKCGLLGLSEVSSRIRKLPDYVESLRPPAPDTLEGKSKYPSPQDYIEAMLRYYTYLYFIREVLVKSLEESLNSPEQWNLILEILEISKEIYKITKDSVEFLNTLHDKLEGGIFEDIWINVVKGFFAVRATISKRLSESEVPLLERYICDRLNRDPEIVYLEPSDIARELNIRESAVNWLLRNLRERSKRLLIGVKRKKSLFGSKEVYIVTSLERLRNVIRKFMEYKLPTHHLNELENIFGTINLNMLIIRELSDTVGKIHGIIEKI